MNYTTSIVLWISFSWIQMYFGRQLCSLIEGLVCLVLFFHTNLDLTYVFHSYKRVIIYDMCSSLWDILWSCLSPTVQKITIQSTPRTQWVGPGLVQLNFSPLTHVLPLLLVPTAHTLSGNLFQLLTLQGVYKGCTALASGNLLVFTWETIQPLVRVKCHLPSRKTVLLC